MRMRLISKYESYVTLVCSLLCMPNCKSVTMDRVGSVKSDPCPTLAPVYYYYIIIIIIIIIIM